MRKPQCLSGRERCLAQSTEAYVRIVGEPQSARKSKRGEAELVAWPSRPRKILGETPKPHIKRLLVVRGRLRARRGTGVRRIHGSLCADCGGIFPVVYGVIPTVQSQLGLAMGFGRLCPEAGQGCEPVAASVDTKCAIR